MKKFYLYFYNTGTIRKIKASSLEEAYKLAEEQFGEASGNYTIGDLPKLGEKVGNVPLKRD